jgi:hypothetical protein
MGNYFPSRWDREGLGVGNHCWKAYCYGQNRAIPNRST